MSLLVWLPLNGNLNNHGLDKDYNTPNINYSAWASEGKIGSQSLYPNTTTSGVLNYSKSLSNNHSYSLCCWVKSVDNTTSSSRYILWTGSDSNSVGFGFRCTNTGTNVQCVLFGTVITLNIGYNQWHHITMIINYEKLKLSAYLDGVFVNEVSYTVKTVANYGVSVGWLRPSYYPFKGYINDVRIYDHCLNPQEVKLISQGLILHYTLDDIQSNNGRVYTEPDESKWVHIFHVNNPTSNKFSSTDTFSNGVYKDENRWFNIYDVVKQLSSYEFLVKQKTTSTATEVKYRWIQTKSPLTAVYEDVAPSTVTRITTTGYTDGGNGGLYILNSNTHMCIANGSKGNWYGGIGTWGTYNGGIPGYPNTTVTTGYIDLYIKIPDNTNIIIYDSSGYQNNGIILGSLTINNDTSKFNHSISFDGNSSGILIENLNISNIINTNLTYAFWIKPNGENSNRSVYFGSYSSASFSIEKTTGNKLRLWWNGSPDITTNLSIIDGQWQHIVITKNGSTEIKIYLNGQLIQTLSNTYNNVTFPTTYRIGRDTRTGSTCYKGLMSDFRIYCTVLSANDIKDLYDTSVYILDNGRVLAYEYLEENNIDINSQGLFKGKDFLEDTQELKQIMIEDTKNVISNSFKEL